MEYINIKGLNTKVSDISFGIAYVLSQKASMVAIIGPRFCKDIDNVINATAQRLTPEQMDFLTLKTDSI